MAAKTSSTARHRRRRAHVALVLVFLCLAAAHALMVAPLYPGDERGHVGYALVVSDGRLPNVDTPMPASLYPRLDSGFSTVWLANHPPLYYAVMAGPLRLANELGDGDGGLRAARLLTALIAACLIPLAAWTARLVLPDRPELSLIAAASVTLLASVPHIFALVHNDALAVVLGAAAFTIGLRILLRGSTTRAWVALSIVMCLAMLTRFSALVPCALAGGVATLGVVLDRRPRTVRAGLRALAWPAATAGAVLITSGWFYARNVRHYGDVTGMHRLTEVFGLHPNGTTWDRLTSGAFYLDQHDQLWARMAGGTVALDRPLLLVARALAAVAVVGLVMAVVRGFGRRPALRPLIAWTAIVAMIPALTVTVAQHAAAGGGAHARYLFPGLTALGALVAAGYGAWPTRIRRVLAPAAFVTAVALNLIALHALLVRQTTALDQGLDRRPLRLERELLAAAGLPWPQVALVALLGVGLVASALVTVELARGREGP